MANVKVKAVKLKSRKHLVLRWLDPITGQDRQRSSGTSNRREAERLAAQLAAEINEGRHGASERIRWEDFRIRFEEEHLPSLAESTQRCYCTALNSLEKHLSPKSLEVITPATMSQYQTRLRRTGVKESTVANRLRHLKAVFRWAHAMGFMAKQPQIKMPRRAGGSRSKGRPITPDEFELMLGAVDQVVPAEEVSEWTFYLNGMWWSGLRAGESLELTWDQLDRPRVDISGEHGKLFIPAEFEKGHKDRELAMAPEFLEHLRQVPKQERTGRIFKVGSTKSLTRRGRKDHVVKKAAAIGKKSGIVVNPSSRDGKPKHVTLHDLRRSFATRWAERGLAPYELQKIMRHESIQTTLNYYVGQDAERTAEAMRKAMGDKTGDKK